MGILRSDRVSGLGGANAINGSVKFSYQQDALIVPPSPDFNLGTEDYTIEAWVYPEQEGASLMIYAVGDSDSTAKMGKFYYRSTKKFTYWCQSGVQITSSGTFNMGSWYHVALVNSSGTQTLYVNGVSQGTSTYSGFGGDAFLVEVGKNPSNTGQSMNGYISNLRVQKGKAEYTAAFTPPTTRLEKTPETVLLCCQSPGDVTQEATGKSLVIGKASGDDSGPVAARFVPDKGEDHGTTFADNTKFDTLSYMVPPGGRTDQRGRGRGVLGGGDSQNTRVGFIDIQSQGTANEFGQLTFGRLGMSACASSTRILFCGGYDSPTNTNIIDFFTIATTSNATDFGDLNVTDHEHCALSNQTRGLIIGGTGPSVQIDYVTIAQAGNALDFADMSSTRRGASGGASPTRGLFCGSATPQASAQIDYVTIASQGTDSQDFGDLTVNRGRLGSVSSSVRTVIAGGYTPSSPNLSNTIDYVTIATTGDAVDFGDLYFAASQMNNGMSNNSRGVFVVTGNPSAVNNLEFITITTTGNSNDFGDAHQAQNRATSGSDSHGGIS